MNRTRWPAADTGLLSNDAPTGHARIIQPIERQERRQEKNQFATAVQPRHRSYNVEWPSRSPWGSFPNLPVARYCPHTQGGQGRGGVMWFAEIRTPNVPRAPQPVGRVSNLPAPRALPPPSQGGAGGVRSSGLLRSERRMALARLSP